LAGAAASLVVLQASGWWCCKSASQNVVLITIRTSLLGTFCWFYVMAWQRQIDWLFKSDVVSLCIV